LTRGTRGKTHPQPAFKVAHLAAGGCFFELNSYFFFEISKFSCVTICNNIVLTWLERFLYELFGLTARIMR